MKPVLYDMTPSPASLIESLRDIGYSMKTAIADLIDNSITAGASEVYITSSWDDDKPWISIIDNGQGMTEDKLIVAMKLGCKSPLDTRSNYDLGRFGLGLKTASFSQCRQLTVICNNNKSFSGMEWDLDSISDTPDSGWQLPIINEKQIREDRLLNDIIEEQFLFPQGTLVLWRKLDRIDNSTNRKIIEKKLNSLLGEVRLHIEITFHRFLEAKREKHKLSIWINKDKLEGHNPFNPKAPATQELPEHRIKLSGKQIVVKPYILPHFAKTSRTEYNKYRGESNYLLNQGFYVYRNRRLIIKGTWFRLIPKTELTKLIRVRVDIPNTLDHLWKIDVKKSNASPPIDVRNKLKEIINKIAERGKIVYKRRGRKLVEDVKIPTWERLIVKDKIKYSINSNYPLLKQLELGLPEPQRKLLDIYISTLESTFPADAYFNDFASCPERMEKLILSENKLEQILDIFLDSKKETEMTIEDSIRMIISSEPFFSQPVMTQVILKKRGLIDD